MEHTSENQNSRERSMNPVNGIEETKRFTDAGVSLMGKTIAKRLGESQFSAPHFYLRTVVNMDNTLSARKEINRKSSVKICNRVKKFLENPELMNGE